MSLLDQLSDKSTWEAYEKYKASLALPKADTKALRDLISQEAYLPAVRRILSGEAFPLPKRAVISKQSNRKKRVVYTYPPLENTVLKVLTYLTLRKYDYLFDPGLYSFRPGRTAKDAIRYLVRTPGIWQMYAYKADISNYFNSIPVEKLLPKLQEALEDDPVLYQFDAALLSEPYVLTDAESIDESRDAFPDREGEYLVYDGKHYRVVKESKGIMAGTPLSAFYANLYLREVDHYFFEKQIPYARYSDDIILFAPTREELQKHVADLHRFLREAGLQINPSKESISAPGDAWIFLGFSLQNGVIDIAPANIQKLKDKMRRKTRALARWKKRNGIEGEKAAKAFIRIFNKKLLEAPDSDHELSWSHWFFPVINTSEGLRQIDHYAQDCIRYLVQGTRTKARYRTSYQDLKKLGYRSLVHEYYQDI